LDLQGSILQAQVPNHAKYYSGRSINQGCGQYHGDHNLKSPKDTTTAQAVEQLMNIFKVQAEKAT